jgi:hypothetical protein
MRRAATLVTIAALVGALTGPLGYAEEHAAPAGDAAPAAPAAPADDAAPAAERPNTCVTCHAQLPDQLAAPVAAVADDVHGSHGLSCSDCHGGDPTVDGRAAMAKAAGFRGKLSRADVITLCAHCHADTAFMRRYDPSLPTNQAALYATSKHGERLARGDQKVATCVSCHGAHGILPPANAASPVYPTNVARTCAHCHADQAYMAEYHIPTNQFADYQQSVHAELLFKRHDLSAPTCNDCHGNHGAYPPEAASVAGVCGQCHAINRDLFLASPHKAAFDRLGLPECVACHGKHAIRWTSDAMLGVGPVAVCITCHADGSTGYQAAAVMGREVSGLTDLIERANTEIDTAARAGMEMTDARFDVQSAHEALIQSRNLVHSFSPERLTEEAEKGQKSAEKASAEATAALHELQQRRRLVVIPLGTFALVLGLLYLKLRQVERDE